MLKNTSKFRKQVNKIIKLVRFIAFFVKTNQVQKIVAERFHELIEVIICSFVFTLHEIPIGLALPLLKTKHTQLTYKAIFTNHPLFAGEPYSSLVIANNTSRVVPIIYAKFSGPKRCFATPAVLYNLSRKSHLLEYPIYAFIYPFVKESSLMVATKEAQVAALNGSDSLSDAVDCLSRVFEEPVYCLPGDILQNDGYTFQVMSMSPMENANMGQFILKDSTSLYQVTSVPSLFPPKRLRLPAFAQGNGKNYIDPSATVSILPPAFRKEFAQITALIVPFLLDCVEERQGKISLPTILFQGVSGTGKRCLATALADSFGLIFEEVNCSSLITESNKATETRFTTVFDAIKGPTLLFLTNVQLVSKTLDGRTNARLANFIHLQIKSLALRKYPVVVIGSCATSELEPLVAVNFTHQFHLTSLDNIQKKETIQWILKDRGLRLEGEVIDQVVQMTPGYKLGDLQALFALAIRTNSKTNLNYCDLERINDVLKSWRSSMKGTPSIQKVTWDDVGGLKPIIQELLDMIELPIKYPDLMDTNLRRSGILLYGPPGTGKTLLARALASQAGLHFLSVKGPELLNMYIGQSEQNIRTVFQRAREASPCLIFFDELDSLAPNRGRSGDSGGVMDRVVSQLLAELDGMQKSKQVYIVGATNRPDLIDPGLLRPGRFDKLIYLGISESKEDKIAILQAQTNKFPLEKDIRWNEIIARIPPSVTGADLYSLCADAMSKAISRQISALEAGFASETLEVKLCDFFEAAKDLVPSLSYAEVNSYKSVRTKISRRH